MRWVGFVLLLLIPVTLPATAEGASVSVNLEGGIESGLDTATWTGSLPSATDVPVVVHYDDRDLDITATSTGADSYLWEWQFSVSERNAPQHTWIHDDDATNQQPGAIAATDLDASGGWYTFYLTYCAAEPDADCGTGGAGTETSHLEVRILPASLRPTAAVTPADGSTIAHPFTLDAGDSQFPADAPEFSWMVDGVDAGAGPTFEPDTAGRGHGSTMAVALEVADYDAIHGRLPSDPVTHSFTLDLRPAFTAGLDLTGARLGDTVSPALGIEYPATGTSVSYSWRNADGDTIGTAETLTLDESEVTYGDDIEVTVTVTHDAQGVSREVTLTETLTNAAPTATLSVPSTTAEDADLQAGFQATDADGDAVECTVQWYKDDVAQGDAETVPDCHEAKTSTVDAADTTDGETWKIEVTPSDGHATGAASTAQSVIDANTAPVVGTISLTPAEPDSVASITASVAPTDADGDTLTTTYQWQRRSGSSFGDVSGEDEATLPASATSKGEVWRVQVTVSDGKASVTATSAEVTIANSAPTVTASITPSPALASDDLSAGATVTDADGDDVVTTYRWQRMDDGSWEDVASGETLASDQTSRGDQWRVVVTAADDEDETVYSSAPVVISNRAPGVDWEASIVLAENGLAVLVVGQVTDADGDELTCLLKWQGPGNASDEEEVACTDGLNVTLDGTRFADLTALEITVEVSDGLDTTSDQRSVGMTSEELDSLRGIDSEARATVLWLVVGIVLLVAILALAATGVVNFTRGRSSA